MGMQVLIKITGLAFLTAYNGSYINSGCIGMIKPQRTLQNAEFENREMNTGRC
jgi:hypothetical protein